MREFDHDLTSGTITRSVWKLAWPVIMLNLVNGAHSIVDHVLVGHFVPSEANAANAAIGVSWQVYMVVVVFLSSLFQGNSVLVAQYAGRKDRAMMSQVTYQVFLASLLILAFVLAPLGYLLAPWLLRLVTTDPLVTGHALPYLRILFLMNPPLFLMFMLTGALQASGEPKTPLKLGFLTTVLNIVISYVLVTGLGPFPRMGTAGAALGTCVAPVVSVAIALGLMARHKTLLQLPSRWTLRLDFSILRTVARIGVPTGVQATVLNIGGALLIRKIGSLEHSAAAQAAYTIAYLQLFFVVMWVSFGLRVSAATLMGQNIGAGQPERAKRAVYVAAILGIGWSALIGMAYWFLPGALLGMFNATNEPVFSYGASLLKVLAFSGVLQAVTLAFTGGLQGAGDTRKPMYIAFLTQIVVLLGLCEIFDRLGVLSIGTIWSAILVTHVVRFVLTAVVFYRGSWTVPVFQPTELDLPGPAGD